MVETRGIEPLRADCKSTSFPFSLHPQIKLYKVVGEVRLELTILYEGLIYSLVRIPVPRLSRMYIILNLYQVGRRGGI